MNRFLVIVIILACALTSKVNAQDFIEGGFAFNLLLDNRGVEVVALPNGEKYEGIIRLPSTIYFSHVKLLR